MAETPRKWFFERKDREGDGASLRSRVKALMDEGLGFNQAATAAMKEFGYQGPKEERRLHEAWLAEQKREVKREVEMEFTGEVKEESRIREFEAALAKLPNTASPSVEIEWVRSHPAMSRLERQVDKTKGVIVSAKDILHSPNGPAPSRGAVNQLIYWANRPAKFYEGLLSEHKKRTDDNVEQRGQQADVSLGDIRNYLSQIQVEKKDGD